MNKAVLSNRVDPGNTISELAISSFSFLANALLDFKDEIAGPALPNNQLNGNSESSITMTDNNFGRFRVTESLLVLNLLVVGRVHGAVLSHNTVGPGNMIGELAVVLPPFWPTRICIFEDEDEDEIVGHAVANNHQHSRDAGITMANNNIGRFGGVMRPCWPSTFSI